MAAAPAGEGGQTAIDLAPDTYDTIDWLVTHIPNNNGRVGQHGIRIRASTRPRA
jgi:hypothetical protein